jgi:Zinc finger, ZZ type
MYSLHADSVMMHSTMTCTSGCSKLRSSGTVDKLALRRARIRRLQTLLHCRGDTQAADKRLAEARHIGIQCDGCGALAFRGQRLHCADCRNYDLCRSCAEKGVQTLRHVAAEHHLEEVPLPLV